MFLSIYGVAAGVKATFKHSKIIMKYLGWRCVGVMKYWGRKMNKPLINVQWRKG
jgi:hypothetical protein